MCKTFPVSSIINHGGIRLESIEDETIGMGRESCNNAEHLARLNNF